jgi:cysteine desulfurase
MHGGAWPCVTRACACIDTRRRGVHLPSLLHGGGQERGARAGTESTLLIAGLGAAAEAAARDLPAVATHMRATRDALQIALLSAFKGTAEGGHGGAGGTRVRVNGPADGRRRLPNTLSISVAGLRAGKLLAELADRLAASGAAACHSGSGDAGAASPVLRAMGVPPEFAAGTLRLSTGRYTTLQEVARAAALILRAVAAQGALVIGGDTAD